jgi:hypothetical protein
MELLRNQVAYEQQKKKRDEKLYSFVRKEKVGNVERKVYLKVKKSSEGTKKVEYVKHNGKFMQLKNYKEMMKKKNLYKSPSPQGKKCKKDCKAIKKECNKVTGRCNKPKPKTKK